MPKLLEKPSKKTSWRMSVTPQKNTTPEKALRKILHQSGLRYRVNYPVLASPRRVADLAFIRFKLAIFVDGCFWHGCRDHVTWPKKNAQFWRGKILANRKRDKDTGNRLKEIGWTSIRIWEHEAPEQAAKVIIKALSQIKRKSNGG